MPSTRRTSRSHSRICRRTRPADRFNNLRPSAHRPGVAASARASLARASPLCLRSGSRLGPVARHAASPAHVIRAGCPHVPAGQRRSHLPSRRTEVRWSSPGRAKAHRRRHLRAVRSAQGPRHSGLPTMEVRMGSQSGRLTGNRSRSGTDLCRRSAATPKPCSRSFPPSAAPRGASSSGTAATRRIDWSRDGRWLVTSPATIRAARDRGITFISPTTGERIDWVALDKAYEESTDPALSPDGRQIAFIKLEGRLLGGPVRRSRHRRRKTRRAATTDSVPAAAKREIRCGARRARVTDRGRRLQQQRHDRARAC